MKFLLDVCVSSRSLTAFLIAQGYDVSTVVALDPRASDEQVLNHAANEQSVLVTEDKDFGELIFAQGLPHGPIVRMVELSVDEQVIAMQELLQHHAHELMGAVIVTVSRGRIRVRRQNA